MALALKLDLLLALSSLFFRSNVSRSPADAVAPDREGPGRGGVGLTSGRLGFGGFGGVTCLSGGHAEPAMWLNFYKVMHEILGVLPYRFLAWA